MKRFSLYQIINLILLVIFVIANIVQITMPMFNLTWQEFWFPMLLLLVSVSMLFKSIIFTSDSALWLFCTLLLLSVGIFLINIFSLPVKMYWVCSLSFVALASFIVGVVFKEIYQVKIGFVFTFISVPFYLYFFGVLGFWWCVLILLGSMIASTLVTMLLPERWYLGNKK